jgi:hypothetical protein
MTLTYVKESVNALPNVAGFLRVLRFLPHRMLTGGLTPNWPFRAMWSDMSHKVAALGTLESLGLDRVELRPWHSSAALNCK